MRRFYFDVIITACEFSHKKCIRVAHTSSIDPFEFDGLFAALFAAPKWLPESVVLIPDERMYIMSGFLGSCVSFNYADELL
jgi:hypothetical protein